FAPSRIKPPPHPSPRKRAGVFLLLRPRRTSLPKPDAHAGRLNCSMPAMELQDLGSSRPRMRKVISVFLPQWPMDVRIRRLKRQGPGQPDKPFIIAALEGQQRSVVAVNTAAARGRVAPGMALSQARAILPDITIAPARPNSDAQALERLAAWSL